jgi:hypothetical protein
MKFLKKLFGKQPTNTVTFTTNVPGMDRLCPVSPASEEKTPGWVSRAHEVFKATMRDPANLQSRVMSVSRCPGMREIMQRGFVVRTWHDFTIKTNGDGHSMSWVTPDEQLKSVVGGDPLVLHNKENFADYFGADWPPHYCKTIIKIQTPWRFSLPKGYVFMVIPVPFNEDTRLESVTGILDPEHSTELNLQIYWKVLCGTELVRRGTPLCYLIPVKRHEPFVLESRVATKEEQATLMIRNLGIRFVDIPHEIHRAIRGKDH